MSCGLPQTIACTLISTLQKAVHHIKTGLGRSGPVYGNEVIPISGIGQGNGMGPILWALISSKLLLMMHTAGHRVRSPLLSPVPSFPLLVLHLLTTLIYSVQDPLLLLLVVHWLLTFKGLWISGQVV